MASMPPHLLIFEPDARGHTLEWIEHIRADIVARHSPAKVSFVVARALASNLADHPPRTQSSRIQIYPLSEREENLCNHRRLAISGFARWWLARKYAKQIGANHILFLALDHLTLPLGLGLHMAGKTVSGILFRPSVHYGELGAYRPGLKERIRDLRKHILYRGMLHNRSVQGIHSLDPYFPAYAAEHYRFGNKVRSLADPAHPAPHPTSAETALSRIVPDGRTAFIFFGEITERKGILQLLAALAQLTPAAARRTAIVVAGRIDPSLQNRVEQMVAQLQEGRPNLWLHLENRRLASGEITALIERSDVVLAPYQHFVGSSGVLLWAAQLEKPVISQEYGLVGQLTREYSLGMAIDADTPSAIANAIMLTIERGPETLGNPARMRAYATSHPFKNFARDLLAPILGDTSMSLGRTFPRVARIASD